MEYIPPMVQYPIVTQRDRYRGKDASKTEKARRFNDASARIEAHLNRQLQNQEQPIKIYLYSVIANELGLSRETVAKCCMVVDGGSNGLTAYRHDMTLEQALEAQSKWIEQASGEPRDSGQS
ncbi:MAG: hypothetical protein ACO1PM_08655 [Acidovorax sp.]